MLQPIVVAPDKQGYKIVAGERRFRASQRAGLEKIPALVRTLSSQHKLELSLIENLQRSDLNPLETATAYLKLRDQFNLTLEEIGQRVGGKTSAAISNTLRLLRLPASARDAIVAGDIREGQARPLIGLPESVVDEIIPRIIKEGWSARAIESYVRRQKANGLGGRTMRQVSCVILKSRRILLIDLKRQLRCGQIAAVQDKSLFHFRIMRILSGSQSCLAKNAETRMSLSLKKERDALKLVRQRRG